MITFSKPAVEQFFRTYDITGFDVSPDEERLVFSSNLDGSMNLWAMELPGTYPYMFAYKNESCSFIKFDSKNRFVLAGFDREGDENHHIYAIPYDGGLPEPIVTGDPEDKYFFTDLSDDGERIYYMTSEDNPSFMNARVYDLGENSDTLLNIGDVSPTELAAVSGDEEVFVYLRTFANTFVTGFVKKGEETHNLTPDSTKPHVTFDPVFVAPNTIYFVTDFESEFNYVAKFDLANRKFSRVLKIENESVEQLIFNKAKNTLFLVTENGVSDKLYRYEMKTEKLVTLSAPVDVIEQMKVTKAGNLYILGRSATVPHNIFQSKFGENWKQLTNNRVLGIGSRDMVEPEVVSYQSFDGMAIESLLFRPKPEHDNGYTIFWPHGGPQAAERKSFRSMFQCALNRGYTIFTPNFRGSTGYGSSFVKLVEQDWGGGPRLDCIAGIEWLFEKGVSDRDKLFLVGGSFGGYMTLLLHGRHPEYFKACVDLFGPSDLFTFVNSVPDHWKPIMKRWLGDPERDRERFINDSPINYLDSMTKPMLVIQGARDPRVVKEESDNIVAKLQEEEQDVEYLVLEDEGHGFSKKENEISVYKQMLAFLEKHQN